MPVSNRSDIPHQHGNWKNLDMDWMDSGKQEHFFLFSTVEISFDLNRFCHVIVVVVWVLFGLGCGQPQVQELKLSKDMTCKSDNSTFSTVIK